MTLAVVRNLDGNCLGGSIVGDASHRTAFGHRVDKGVRARAYRSFRRVFWHKLVGSKRKGNRPIRNVCNCRGLAVVSQCNGAAIGIRSYQRNIRGSCYVSRGIRTASIAALSTGIASRALAHRLSLRNLFGSRCAISTSLSASLRTRLFASQCIRLSCSALSSRLALRCIFCLNRRLVSCVFARCAQSTIQVVKRKGNLAKVHVAACVVGNRCYLRQRRCWVRRANRKVELAGNVIWGQARVVCQQLYTRNTHRNRIARGVLVSKRKAAAR